MKAKWLLQGKDVFKENIFELENVIKSCGLEYKIVNYIPFQKEQFLDVFDSKDCVIFYGSLSLAQAVRRQTSWVPGVWCDLAKFECTYYYNYYGEFLLNNRYLMLPYGELIRQKDLLFEVFGNNNCIFVRPSSGFKIFTGNVLVKEYYKSQVSSLNMCEIDKEKIVIVSEPKNIEDEWRLIVVGGKVVAASRYHLNGKLNVSAGCPETVWDFGNHIASVWTPEPAFAMDICRIGNDIKLLEVNSFSCSSLYDCDKKAVVEAVSEQALKEFNDVYGIETRS